MRLPRLLNGNIVPCVSLSVNQSIIPLSNATMEVLKGDVLPIRTYVEITTPNGITEIYRTRQPQVTHGSDVATIQLDHAISEVGDFLIQDAIEEETTVSEAFSTIFSHYRGTAWQLGTITASDDVTLDVDYDNVLESLLGILEQVPQYYMTFDFTTSPWTLGIAEKTYTVTAEGRLSRNIESAVVKYDDKDQCTRVYVKGLPKPSGQEDDEDAIGYMDADANTIALYGIIEKETGSGNLTEEQATRVATAYLNAHKLPKKSVEINGDDLSEITGESLDSFVTGKLFRLAIPQDGQVVEDYITKVSFQDIISSSYADVIIGDEQDATLNFLQEQASSTKSSRSSSKKQQKLDEVFEKNFVKTNEYGAILEQAGMKLDSHGMIVYAKDNVNNIASILEQTASEIRAEVAAGDLGLRSEISQTASAIRLSVANSLSDIGSNIIQTADQIYSEVHSANSSIYSYIAQTSTSITSRVEDINDDLHTEILQTKSMIRSAVWTANSQVYSYVDQTASYILDHVGERTGAKVFTGTSEPEDSPDNPINVGDMWLDGDYVNFWDDADFKFVSYDPDDPEYDWTQLRGAKLKVWKDGKWQLVEDYTTLAEDTDIRRTKDQINLVAHNLVSVNGELQSNIARLDVKADRITSSVNERIADVGSRITQTARQIRNEVHASQSQLYSAIEQTATNIRSYVRDEINDVGSEIEQTASMIRHEVHASQSQLYSAIEQTATSIRSYVKNEIDDVGSEILQTANQIRSEVHTANSRIYSAIAQTATSIRSYVKNEIDDVGSEILQTASMIRSEVHTANSKIYSSITQTASSIRSEVRNAISGVNSSITQTANQIRSEVNAANSKVYSSITQTASSIRSEVRNAISGVNSSITQTANQIRSEVNAANSKVYSSITQTASQIRAEVGNAISGVNSSITQTANSIRSEVNSAISGVNSSITQTANQIRSEVDAANSTIYSAITQTASQIRLEVKNTASGLQSQITQNADNIELKVSQDGVISSINQSAEAITISASKINLDGYVTSTNFSSVLANLSKAHINRLYVDVNMYAPNGLEVFANGVWQLGLSQSGNTYTLTETKLNGDQRNVGSFSRAITEWQWAGGNGKVYVSAYPQAQTLGVDVDVSGDFNISSNGTYRYKVYYCDNTGSQWWDTGAWKDVTVSVGTSPTAEISYNAQEDPTGISDSLGTISTPDLYDWYIITAKSGTSSKPYKLKVDSTAKWTEGFNYDDGSTHHNLHVYGGSYATIYSGTTVIPRGQTYTVYPGFKKYGAAGTADADIVWGSAVSFRAASGTQITMTRGAYSEQSRTYSCTCTVSGSIATGSTFYLYAF